MSREEVACLSEMYFVQHVDKCFIIIESLNVSLFFLKSCFI